MVTKGNMKYTQLSHNRAGTIPMPKQKQGEAGRLTTHCHSALHSQARLPTYVKREVEMTAIWLWEYPGTWRPHGGNLLCRRKLISDLSSLTRMVRFM